jgi:hypothetical protein
MKVSEMTTYGLLELLTSPAGWEDRAAVRTELAKRIDAWAESQKQAADDAEAQRRAGEQRCRAKLETE